MSSSSPNRHRGGGESSGDKEGRPRFFDHKAKKVCWDKAETVPGRHPERWRKDAAGNVVCKRFCNCQGCLCFEYDHIVPYSKGGESVAENCQILQTRVNRFKSDKDGLDKSQLRGYSCDIKFTGMDKIHLSVTCHGEWKSDGERHTFEGERLTKGFSVKKGSTYEELTSEINRKMKLGRHPSQLKLHHRWGGDMNPGIPPSVIDGDSDVEDCFHSYEAVGFVPLYVTVGRISQEDGEGSSEPGKIAQKSGGESGIVSLDRDMSEEPYLENCSIGSASLAEFLPEDIVGEEGDLDENIHHNQELVLLDADLVDNMSPGCDDQETDHSLAYNKGVHGDDEYSPAINEDVFMNDNVDDSYQVSEGVTPSNRRVDGSGMRVGDFFDSIGAFDLKVRDTCVRHGDLLHPHRKSSVERVWRCKDKACAWRARVSQVDGTTMFELRQYHPYHTCSLKGKSLAHEQCTSQYIAERIKDQFYDVLNVPSVRKVREFCVKTLNQPCSNFKALDAHKKAMKMVCGDAFENYADIPSYLYMVQQLNEGTIVELEVDEEDRFKYCFLALGASVRGFEYMRPVITIDAVFSKSKYKGQLVVASASDAQNHIYPIACGIIDVECNLAWTWFLEKLKVVVTDKPGLVFLSDRHNAIIDAVATVYCRAVHVHCYDHLKVNLTTKFPGGGWGSLFHKVAYTCSVVEFEKLFDAMRKSCTSVSDGKTICQYLEENVGFQKWARAHCPQRRYEIMTCNHADSFNSVMRNAREAPPIYLLDHVVNTCSQWFKKHLEEGMSYSGDFVPAITTILDKNFQDAKSVTCIALDKYVFQIRSAIFEDHVVNLKEGTCTCGSFQINEIPCVHACAATKKGPVMENKTSAFYTSDFFKKAYSEIICQVPCRVQWDRNAIPEEVRKKTCLPPHYVVKWGRQQIKRLPSVGGERVLKMKRSYKCKHCALTGHSKKYCPKLQLQ